MQTMRYLENAVTLSLDAEKCTGCRTCALVCPHGVFAMADKRAVIVDRGACIECGACALNCSAGAISVTPGVGCASAIIRGWLTGTDPSCGCSDTQADPDTGDCCGGESADVTPGASRDCCGDGTSRGGSCC